MFRQKFLWILTHLQHIRIFQSCFGGLKIQTLLVSEGDSDLKEVKISRDFTEILCYFMLDQEVSPGQMAIRRDVTFNQ